MPSKETLENFIQMVESNRRDKTIEIFYTEDASMQENLSEPRVGRDNLVANERKILSKVQSMTSTYIHPVFVNNNYVVIRWKFHVEWKDGSVFNIGEWA